jgi:cytochrome P450
MTAAHSYNALCVQPEIPESARRIIIRSLREAGRQGRALAQPEDLLRAVLGEFDRATGMRLSKLGVDRKRVELALQPVPVHPAATPAPQLSPQTSAIVKAAMREAADAGAIYLGGEHLLLALASSESNAAQVALRSAGVDHANLRAAIDSARRAADHWQASAPLRAVSRARLWLRKSLRFPRQAYAVFFQRSLGNSGFVTNPYPLYRWLQEHDPVRPDPLAPVWILTRYDDVAMMLRDPRFTKDPFAEVRLSRVVREQIGLPMDSARSGIETISMLFLDPPDHTRVRAMFTKAFSPRVIESMRPRIQQITRKRLDRAAERGQMDIIADLAYPLPVVVIAELLGFPPEDYERIKQWSDQMAGSLALTADPAAHALAATARDELREYFNHLVPTLKEHRSDNLISTLLTTEHLPEALNREEIFSNAVLLLAAGHETTTNLIGNGMLALLNHPDQFQLLREKPELIDSAVEEFLRYDSPVQWSSRVTGETMEVGGKTIEPARIVLGALGAANRDPRVFTDPDRLDIQRSPNRHIAFGQGPHFCLGAALARMEASISISELVRRFGKLRLAHNGKLPMIGGLTFRGVKKLPVALK